MTQSDKLRRVLKIREQSRARRARYLQQTSGVLNEQRQQRDDLADLLSEYRKPAETVSVHASVLANRQRFYGQMDQVLRAQESAVAHSERQHQEALTHYLESYREHDGLQRLLTRRELAHKIDLKRRSRRASPGQARKHLV